MRTNPIAGAKSANNVHNISFHSMLVQEIPPIKADTVTISSSQEQNPVSASSKHSEPPVVPGIYVAPPVPLDKNGQMDSNDPAVRRFMASLGFPDWVGNVCQGGNNTLATSKERSEFTSIVMGYFKEVKEEFGCDDSSYLPYHSALPEYDKEIAEQMKASFYGKIEANARAESLSEKLGVLWPPARNTCETASGIRKISVMY